MYTPGSILRPLLLVVLLGGLGVAAQPAAAQQTVTLSGRVTDSTGNAVPGALVCAHLSTEQWWEGSCYETEAGGRFQLQVRPAEYVITVRPGVPPPADPASARGQRGGGGSPRADSESAAYAVRA